MTALIQKAIVGEAGDVLILETDHRIYFGQVPSEDAGDGYVRLIGLPPIMEVGNEFPPLIALTFTGQIIAISNEYPGGFQVELDYPPLKRYIPSDPAILLDINNTVHFTYLGNLIDEQTNNSIDWGYQHKRRKPVQFTTIEDVKNILYGIQINYSNNQPTMIITDTSIIYGSLREVSRGDGRSMEITGKIMGRFILEDKILSVISLTLRGNDIGVEKVSKINYQIADIGMSGGEYPLYTLDTKGTIREYYPYILQEIEGAQKNANSRIVKRPSAMGKPVRFLIEWTRDLAIEDEGRNIYSLPKLELQEYPIRLMNLEDLSTNLKRFKTTKRVIAE